MENPCKHCGKGFATPSSRKRHEKAQHTEKTTSLDHKHPCPRCNARFPRNETLQRHIGSKHTLELMVRCQFCLENFRKDYFDRHESTCAKKYWANVCRIAELTKEIRPDRSNETNLCPPARRRILPDVEPIPVADKGLRVVREIDVDMRLASRAFDFVFFHCAETGDVDSCLEAITASFRHNVPIKRADPAEPLGNATFYELSSLAQDIGKYVRGERDINDRDVEGSTIMDLACSTGATSLIEPLSWRRAEFGNKSLLYAVRSGSFYTVRFCLALGADPNDYSLDWDYGDSPLMFASSKSETSHLVSLLIEYGANVFVRNDNWETPLHLAARRADVDLLRVLLARDSSSEFLHATDKEGESALHNAIESMNHYGIAEGQALEFVSALLDAGADVHGFYYHQSALRKAVMFDCGAVLQLLLSREPESPQMTRYLKEALMDAIDGGFRGTFEILVEAGASVDDGMLRNVLESGSLEQLELFFKAGAPGDFVEDETLELLFGAARDQQGHGAEGWVSSKWADVMGKYKLLCLCFPDDRRLRRFMDALEFEVENFR
jgi:ankyrin repeat protein